MKKLLAAVMAVMAGSSYAADFSALQSVKAGDIAAAETIAAPEAAAGLKDGWRHIRLTAADGTGITVDYSVQELAGSVVAAPVWINVSGGNFNNVGNVRVLLINYYLTNGPIQLEDTQQLDLKYSGGTRFTGQLRKVLMSEETYMYGGNIFRQELAVVVDGKWLRDPVSNTNNFRFQLIR